MRIAAILFVLSFVLAPAVGADDLAPPEEEALLPFRYARAWDKPVPVFGAMGDPEQMIPEDYLLPPDSWISIDEEVEQDGRLWYRADENSYVLAEDLVLGTPSVFQGVHLEQQPAHPVGFVAIGGLNVRARPGATADNPPVSVLGRYDVVDILGSQAAGDGVWYQIGEDRFVHSAYVRVVYPVQRPPEVSAEERWIAVDLAQQTLAAYEGDRMVLATLVASGRPPWYTPPGLFRIWIKLQTAPMVGGTVEEGDYYYLQDVPWTMYFSRDVGLHGAYWHDRFGTPRSHGCVNLSPLDASWLFDWTTPAFPRPDQRYVYASPSNPGTWVYVYSTG